MSKRHKKNLDQKYPFGVLHLAQSPLKIYDIRFYADIQRKCLEELAQTNIFRT